MGQILNKKNDFEGKGRVTLKETVKEEREKC